MSEEEYSVRVENKEELTEVLWCTNTTSRMPSSEYSYPTDITVLESDYCFGQASIHYENIQAWRGAV